MRWALLGVDRIAIMWLAGLSQRGSRVDIAILAQILQLNIISPPVRPLDDAHVSASI